VAARIVTSCCDFGGMGHTPFSRESIHPGAGVLTRDRIAPSR
jgi:hypothetical protein